MKTLGLNKTVKFSISIIFTILFTVLGVNAWAGLTAQSGDKLDYQKWNELVNTVQSGTPTGAIMVFNLPSCQTGWSAYTAAAGRTVIGAGNGAGLKNRIFGETGGGEAAVSYKIHILPGSTGVQPANGIVNYWTTGTKIGASSVGGFTTTAPSVGNEAWLTGITPIGDQTGLSNSTDNMQPYVALLYCVKN